METGNTNNIQAHQENILGSQNHNPVLQSPIIQQPAQEQEALITDFSSVFKRKSSFIANQKKTGKAKINSSQTPNWLLEIPAKLQITKSDLQARRYIDTVKWTSVAKTDENWKKIVAAACSCWNHLKSKRGIGQEKFLSINQFISIVSKQINMEQIKQADEFNRYRVFSRMIEAINKQLNSKLTATIICKLAHPDQLPSSAVAQKQQVLASLTSVNKCHIYLTFNDVMFAIGFDKTPLKQLQAYEKIDNISQESQQLWLIFSSLGHCEPSFSIKRWSDIQKDLEIVWPNYLDIKQVKQGIRLRPEANQQNSKQNRGTSSCLIQICSSD